MAAVAVRSEQRSVPVGPPARPRRAGARRLSAAECSTTTAGARLGTLAGHWWTALEAADSALSAAGHYMSGQDLAEHNHHLGVERRDAVQQLQALARDLQVDSRMLRLLAAPTLSKHMLGLPSEVEACVFDLDGVLTTSAGLHAAAWAETLDPFLLERAEQSRREYIPFDPVRDYNDYLAGRTRLAGIRAFLASRGLGLPEGALDDPPGLETVHALANRKNQALQRHLEREGVAAFEGVRCYLEAARMLGLRRAVVSASANTETILERAGLAQLVELHVDGTTIAASGLHPKPAPDMLLAACRQLDIEPQRVAAFETAPAGISAARAAGVGLAVAVNPQARSRPPQTNDADFVVADLAEILDHNLAR